MTDSNSAKQAEYEEKRKRITDLHRMPDTRDLRTLAEIREEAEENARIEKMVRDREQHPA